MPPEPTFPTTLAGLQRSPGERGWRPPVIESFSSVLGILLPESGGRERWPRVAHTSGWNACLSWRWEKVRGHARSSVFFERPKKRNRPKIFTRARGGKRSRWGVDYFATRHSAQIACGVLSCRPPPGSCDHAETDATFCDCQSGSRRTADGRGGDLRSCGRSCPLSVPTPRQARIPT